ncbi:MAG: DUF1015 domain-containing protein, partial [Candidatus Aminicenantes bacterium]|nr:DUF1015 domain-containing protein [Candidatus Aminicenantes bacterium]
MSVLDRLALSVPDILLPAEGVDLTRWAVIACDQFTSEPEYWEEVRRFVGPAPSTLNLIFPEAFLGKPGEEERIASIRAAMRDTLARGLLRADRGFVYIERQTGARTRRGLLACLDLEAYDYAPGSLSLIRATEGTILDRIPPRVKIREGAPLELPHIMVLFDDRADTVIGPLAEARDRLEKLYDFELMMDSGRLAGYRIGAGAIEDGVMRALESLADPEAFRLRYGVPKEKPVLLFAMGDGNHSLATAKAIWERTKRNDPQGAVRSPLRHALVELVNLHDPALVFEPIHRVVFGVGHDPVEEWKRSESGEGVVFHPVAGLEEMRRRVDAGIGRSHKIGVVRPEGFGVLEVNEPSAQMPVGSLQGFLDRFLEQGGAREADYVHGAEIVSQLGRRPGNAGFYLPAMAKDDLFRTIILDGVLPRKTFSMG